MINNMLIDLSFYISNYNLEIKVTKIMYLYFLINY